MSKKKAKPKKKFESAQEASDVVNKILLQIRKDIWKGIKPYDQIDHFSIVGRVVNALVVTTYRPLFGFTEEAIKAADLERSKSDLD